MRGDSSAPPRHCPELYGGTFAFVNVSGAAALSLAGLLSGLGGRMVIRGARDLDT